MTKFTEFLLVKREIKVHQLRGLRVHHSLVELL